LENYECNFNRSCETAVKPTCVCVHDGKRDDASSQLFDYR
jgi:hypothetical protein